MAESISSTRPTTLSPATASTGRAGLLRDHLLVVVHRRPLASGKPVLIGTDLASLTAHIGDRAKISSFRQLASC
jgi:hypothetical protein